MKNIKTKTSVIIITLLAVVFTSCDNYGLIGIKGSGPVVTNAVEMTSLEGIELEIPGNVYITKGATEDIRIDAQQNIFDNIETIVSNGVVKVKFKKNVRKSEDINVYISMEQLKKLSISGSGDVMADASFSSEEKLDINISGSGNIDIAVDAPEVEMNISGSGDIKLVTNTHKLSSNISGSGDILLSGQSALAYHTTSGSGDVKAYDFETEDCSVSTAGSGTYKVFATKSLNVKIAGSGNVYYKGTPSMNVDVSGSGSVISAN